ncbi:hypothetical protein TCAL_03469 [Tigriopus californicus]|uniref:BZIP domain-containing protein n=1 Tax=Tigriopus californicus TaxID=6832 RepID=A0A553NQ90_TIGCA|nr:cyclic AMP-responsive element-binding protein 3-like protein 2 [Tigriopus californicus]TRY67587.1 hypothetical protein TCAL_03469 [Tigriopus californicus]|eukprot:TCALIF_03469-PA protein Name:"Similar to CREB3L4 Cyclic AMP-responsive element-binding protein 3-like protein 4 (Homo sapiens)" AED:0.00 eAED:0.00 QI:360/1/1/1/1/1/5/642/596
MSSDFGLLDILINDAGLASGSPSLDMGDFEGVEPFKLGQSGGGSDMLTYSMEQSGILPSDKNLESNPDRIWGKETDDLLQSILTGNDSHLGFGCSEFDGPFSDTSSDSGCNLEQQLLSPGSSSITHLDDQNQTLSPQSGTSSSSPSSGGNLMEYVSSNTEEEDNDQPLQVVNPVTNSPEPITIVTSATQAKKNPKNFAQIITPVKPGLVTTSATRSINVQQIKTIPSVQTGTTTTIVLPVINARQQTLKSPSLLQPSPPSSKRRRISVSSSDSGLDDIVTTPSPVRGGGSSSTSKYPPLLLNEEEKRLCERECVKLPSHYPLSREEEKNLKRIRRKIRNKVSAQDSRKRKKEYVDAMEERVRNCTNENDELNKKIELLETQNKTLAGQLRRLHQIITNGGLKQTQTSTAMMVLLLSTALFLIPGFKDQQESKCDLDITQAVKMPPMPGQSRSLLHFTPQNTIKQEFAANPAMNGEELTNGLEDAVTPRKNTPMADHDYFATKMGRMSAGSVGRVGVGKSILDTSRKVSYIEEDAPPLGYGPDKLMDVVGAVEEVKAEPFIEVEVTTSDEIIEKRINVTSGESGMRTVVLHVPKDFK